jgi:hypothetical protein|tara:strand:- start:21011 stop:21253 length:243 start_codon:yes stop_codon:yes gene_type:complete
MHTGTFWVGQMLQLGWKLLFGGGSMMVRMSRYSAQASSSWLNLRPQMIFSVRLSVRPLRQGPRSVIFNAKYRRYYPIRRT